MRSKILKTSLFVITLTLLMAGCAARGAPERKNAAQEEAIYIDILAAQEGSAPTNPDGAAQPTGTRENTATTTQAPAQSAQTETTSARSKAQIDALMDELEKTLDGLDDSIDSIDQDTLQDATLAALEK
jgi:hypothetical protein